MRPLTEVVSEIKWQINREFPNWNEIVRLANEAETVEDNEDGGYEKNLVLHITYTDLVGKVRDADKRFPSTDEAEDWLRKIGAKYWSIGIADKDIESLGAKYD